MHHTYHHTTSEVLRLYLNGMGCAVLGSVVLGSIGSGCARLGWVVIGMHTRPNLREYIH